MGMNIGSGSASGELEVMSEINTTPLIDVMLVLLIMLIITIPIQLHTVNLNMPVGNPPPATPPEIIKVNIDAGGTVTWNGEALDGKEALESHLKSAAAQAVHPELHVRPDKRVAYSSVVSVMAAIQKRGLTKVGLVGSEQFQ